MDEKILKAALAGLLHDVGKFAQRTTMRPSRIWKDGTGEAEREYKYEHAVFSGDFVERYLPTPFKPLSPPAYHHAPQSDFDRLIQLADHLSAGERDADVDRAQQPKQTQAILTRVRHYNPEGTPMPAEAPTPHYHALKPLVLDETTLFPLDTTETDEGGYRHEALWQDFVKETGKLRDEYIDAETYLENMVEALRRYTWCVPSAYYKSVPDVSLYDHSRMTAALAACLTEQTPEQINRWLDRQDLDKPTAVLIGGDISGVQDFIYTITSKKAAKTLRGRSFYLQLLTEAVLRFVLRELGMPYINIIYSGGGHFYLLAPASAEGNLRKLRRKVTETLLTHHNTVLYLALGCAPVPAGGFATGEFYKHWNAMHRDLGRAKQQRYTELDRDLGRAKQQRYTELGNDFYSKVFEPKAHGGNKEKVCSTCGEESKHTKKAPEPDDENAKICPLCDSFAELGEKLAEAEFVALGLSEPQVTEKHKATDVLRAFGLEVKFAKHAGETVAFDAPAQRAILWALGDTENWPTIQNAPAARAMRYTVNRAPKVGEAAEADSINKQVGKDEWVRPGDSKTFNHLQVQAGGIARLGVLRMDVDNLGDLFKDGFGLKENSRATLSRLAALSFSLSLFFEGWVKHLCELPEYEGFIYAVYAGGDDVFLIGPWDKIPALASRIAKDLSRYSGQNPAVHVSGGMSFIHGKYPVYQAAEDAHEALEQAKHREGKNAFSFLGQTWRWDEFTDLTGKFEQLKNLTDTLGAPQAILQVLRKLADDRKEDKRKRTLWGPWTWQSVYHFARRAKQAGEETPIGRELIAIRDSLKNNNYQNLAQWGAAARWAQLWLRNKDD